MIMDYLPKRLLKRVLCDRYIDLLVGGPMNDFKIPPDNAPPDLDADSNIEESSLEENIKSRSTWLRLLFMVLFAAIWSVSRVVVIAVMLLQFCIVLVKGKTNTRLNSLAQSLATYSYQLVAYLAFVTEAQPFPFDDWPTEPPG